jgi:hypothetical protein
MSDFTRFWHTMISNKNPVLPGKYLISIRFPNGRKKFASKFWQQFGINIRSTRAGQKVSFKKLLKDANTLVNKTKNC